MLYQVLHVKRRDQNVFLLILILHFSLSWIYISEQHNSLQGVSNPVWWKQDYQTWTDGTSQPRCPERDGQQHQKAGLQFGIICHKAFENWGRMMYCIVLYCLDVTDMMAKRQSCENQCGL